MFACVAACIGWLNNAQRVKAWRTCAAIAPPKRATSVAALAVRTSLLEPPGVLTRLRSRASCIGSHLHNTGPAEARMSMSSLAEQPRCDDFTISLTGLVV